MKIIILQHIECETPGFIKDLMIKDGFKLTTIQLNKNEKIPSDLAIYDGMLCMGGPMDTWMENDYPWLIEEKKKIKQFVVDLEKPFLGFCLGGQLLGEILGGEVIKSSHPEIGILNINMLESRKEDSLFLDFPNKINALQWHSYEVSNLEKNKNIVILGSSPTTKYQIFKYKTHAYGIQFHIEIKDDTIDIWGCVPEYKIALENSLGKNSLHNLNLQAKTNMKQMNKLVTILYKNFIKKLIR